MNCFLRWQKAKSVEIDLFYRMSSALINQICAKCKKNAATAMCYGCDQSFCTKHFLEHREQLGQQLDSIGQEYEHLSRELSKESSRHPLFTRIDQWEKETFARIQAAAETARQDLRQYLAQTNSNLINSLKKIKETLQTSQQTDNFTELNIVKWNEQLKELREMRENNSSIYLENEGEFHSTIHLIKVRSQSDVRPSSESVANRLINSKIRGFTDERFDSNSTKSMTFSNDGRKVTFYGENQIDSCSVACIGRYSTRTHSIRFRLEHVENPAQIFLGIVTASQEINSQVLFSPSTNGWCELDFTMINGQVRESNFRRIFRTSDELTMTLNCDKQMIRLEHHRTGRAVQIPVDHRYCPFPWKILVQLSLSVNSISIVH